MEPRQLPRMSGPRANLSLILSGLPDDSKTESAGLVNAVAPKPQELQDGLTTPWARFTRD
jgi:hypothetical protein